MASSMKPTIHLGPDFSKNFGKLQEHKIREHRECVQHHSNKKTEHSGEILNLRSLEYSSPSRTRSTLVNDEAVKWAKAKAGVYADSVLEGVS